MRYFSILLVLILGLSVNAHSSVLYWFTGTGIKKPAEKIARMFEKKYKENIAIISGGSGQVLNEMLEAKKGDIYTLVDTIFLKKAIKYNAIVDYKTILKLTPVFILSNKEKQKIKDIYCLAKPGVKVAGGNPKAMCLGQTFVQIMDKLPIDIAKKINKNIAVKCLNVFQIIGYVKNKTVDAGIVLDKALIRNTNLRYIEIPNIYNVHRYGYLTLVSYSKHKAEAKKLFDFIWSHRKIYEEYGFKVVGDVK